MKKVLLYLFILPLFVACSSDDEDDSGKTEKVDMIFNEPLFLYDKTKEEVKLAEHRTLKREVPDTLLYSETKNNLSYIIKYHFKNSKVKGMHVVFEYSAPLSLSVQESLALNYIQKSKMPIVFYSDELKRYIALEKKGNTIEIQY